MKDATIGYTVTELLKEFEKRLGFQTKIIWLHVILFSALHAFAFYWCYLHTFPVKWQTLVLAWVMYVFSGTGVTVGVHRYWAHKCFKATLPLKIYLMLSYAAAGQYSIFSWVRDHRVHHKYSDTDADPHNINRGFFFAHIGWLMMERNSLVKQKGRQIDMSDILQDPVAIFDRKYMFTLRIIFSFILPTITGILLWGETWQCAVAWQYFIRVLFILHISLSVNSFAHTFGTKPYNKHIMPTQNVVLSFLSIGEGGHNYHHTFPSDYRSKEAFDFLNVPTYFVRACAKMGLVYDLKEPCNRQTKDKKLSLGVKDKEIKMDGVSLKYMPKEMAAEACGSEQSSRLKRTIGSL